MVRPTVLIVDDHEPMRVMLREALLVYGYEVIAAASGSEGLAIAAVHAIDCVVTDLDMPGMNGVTFCQRLREQTSVQGRLLPVWIMTGVYRSELIRKALDAGAVSALQKPFDVSMLCRQFQCYFESQTRAAAAPVATNVPESVGRDRYPIAALATATGGTSRETAASSVFGENGLVRESAAPIARATRR
jgi:CheY-like chemotaxis protein